VKRKALRHKAMERIASKQVADEKGTLSVTAGVTQKGTESPAKRYAALKPWIGLANGEAVGALRLGEAAWHLTPTMREILSKPVRRALERLVAARPLLSSAEFPKWWIERGAKYATEISLGWREHDLPYERQVFADLVLTLDGRLQRNPINVRDSFVNALAGAELDRVRQCGVCDRFFFARRTDQKACGKPCNQTRRVREWRKKAEYELRRKFRRSGVELPEELKPKRKERKR
jgi:hypothetical protein